MASISYCVEVVVVPSSFSVVTSFPLNTDSFPVLVKASADSLTFPAALLISDNVLAESLESEVESLEELSSFSVEEVEVFSFPTFL